MVEITENPPGRYSTKEQNLSFRDITNEYKRKPTDPELLTQFMIAFWKEAGRKT